MDVPTSKAVPPEMGLEGRATALPGRERATRHSYYLVHITDAPEFERGRPLAQPRIDNCLLQRDLDGCFWCYRNDSTISNAARLKWILKKHA
jgi:hypothetical protein